MSFLLEWVINFLVNREKKTLYSLRAIPIGGFCQLAGEEGEEEEGIPLERTLQGKKVWQKVFSYVLWGWF